MPLYDYKVSDREGKKISGSVYALTETDAAQVLEKQDFLVIKLEEKKKRVFFWQKSYGNISYKEKIIFLKYLATILESGLSIKKALDLLATQSRSGTFAKVIGVIRESVENGQSFKESLKKFPGSFSPTFVNIVGAGEASGTLPQVLKYLENLLRREYDLRQKIIGAMIYPIMIFILVVAISVGLVKFIVPKITKIFEKFDVTLPFFTRVLIGLEKFLSAYLAVIVLATISLIIGFWLITRLRGVRKSRDALFLFSPVIGRLIKQLQITAFMRTAATLIKSGLPMIRSLEIAGETLKNLVYVDFIAAGVKFIGEGGDLASYLEKRPDLFEPLISQMVRLGENTGSIENSMNTVADLNEDEARESIKIISEMISPLMLIVMGVIVGGLAVSVMMPIYQLPSLIGKR